MRAIWSADGHVIEPADLFTERVPAHLRDRALRYDYHGPYQDMVVTTGTMTTSRFPRPGGGTVDEDASAEAYLRDFESEGVWGSTLYPNLGMHMFVPDHEFAIAHARVYNDYVAETYGAYPERLLPVACVPLTDVDDAVAEIERAAALGLRGALLPTLVPVPWYTRHYERVWSAIADAGMTATMHTLCGFELDDQGNVKPRIPPVGRTMHSGDEATKVAARTNQFVNGAQIPQNIIGQLAGSGVFERHRGVTLIIAELQAFWLPSLMGAMDKAWTLGIGQPESWISGDWDHANDTWFAGTVVDYFEFNRSWPYPLKPSEYLRRQLKVTFMDDPMAVACREAVGVETLVWGSDYPHPEATWPSSNEAVEQLMRGVGAADRDAILGGTLAGLYGIQLPVVV